MAIRQAPLMSHLEQKPLDALPALVRSVDRCLNMRPDHFQRSRPQRETAKRKMQKSSPA
jgi:hypothetical protein